MAQKLGINEGRRRIEEYTKTEGYITSEYTNYLLQCFNDYDVPIEMTPEEVRELLIKFEKEYNN